jgi:hypothetical protein
LLEFSSCGWGGSWSPCCGWPPGSLLITASGICHLSLTTSHFISWDAMVVAAADWIGTPVIAVKAVPAPDTRIRRYMGRLGSGELRFWPFMVIRTGWLASDPIVVYHALAFYHAHPELRGSWPHRRLLPGSAAAEPSATTSRDAQAPHSPLANGTGTERALCEPPEAQRHVRDRGRANDEYKAILVGNGTRAAAGSAVLAGRACRGLAGPCPGWDGCRGYRCRCRS